jgi:hypothetical protein
MTIPSLKEATMPVKEVQVDQKLTELQIAPPSEPSPHERVVIPGGIRECIVLRARDFPAKYTQAGQLTVPQRHMSAAQRLIAQIGTRTWLEDGRRLIWRGA